MKRIGIVAALPAEIKPLVRGWARRGQLYTGRVGEFDAVAACAGMGASAVTRACEMVLAAGDVDTLISVGWAGALSCGLQVGGSYAVREVIDARSGERFNADYPEGHRLITLNHVAAAQEKRRLAETYQAVMVDMEASTVARLAQSKGLRFYCFKAISDGPSDQLPDFNRFTGADGQLRKAALLSWALLHPGYWTTLGRLGKNSHQAAEQLAWFVPRCLQDAASRNNA